MTLAAAFRCPKGGFLLCSDREWNDGVSKRSVDMIYRIGNFAPCDFFIAGAGPEAIIKKTWAAIHEAVASAASNGQDVLHDHRLIIEATLRTIHEQCAKTLQDYPMWLLIVVAPRADGMAPFLYLTNADILIPEPYYAAIGSGKTIADYFSDRLYEYGRLDKDSMKVLATFILREAGESSAGVGMGADMMFINEGEKAIHYIFSGSIKEIASGIPSLSDAIWSYWKDHAKLPERLAG